MIESTIKKKPNCFCADNTCVETHPLRFGNVDELICYSQRIKDTLQNVIRTLDKCKKICNISFESKVHTYFAFDTLLLLQY